MLNLTASASFHENAKAVIAGGVNSNVRLGERAAPLCFSHGKGSKLFDVDGNEYIDYALGTGPAIVGHAPSFLVEEVAATLNRGQRFAGQSPRELKLARLLQAFIPSAELVRIGCTGSEMVQAALRVARAFTGRNGSTKFEGHHHGWFDNVLVNQAGPAHAPDGPIPFPVPLPSAGQAPNAAVDTHVLPWNDTATVSRFWGKRISEIAALIMEPVMCNTGVIAPRSGYLQAVKDLCTHHGIVFIMDEVITGLRLQPGIAQEMFDVRPYLSIFAKALGGGFPISALVGWADIMSVIDSGRINHSGTYNANVVSVGSGIAMMEHVVADRAGVYEQIGRLDSNLMRGIQELADRRKAGLKVIGHFSVFHTFFTEEHETFDYFSYQKSDSGRRKSFIEALPASGIRPTNRGTWFVSAAHTTDDVKQTLEAVDRVLAALTTERGATAR